MNNSTLKTIQSMNTKQLNFFHTVAFRCFLLSAFFLACFALSPTARAVDPPPDGGYPNNNTAEGDGALFSLRDGFNNTAIGFNALYSLKRGSEETAIGSLALANDTAGLNTACGFNALNANTTGAYNTAMGRNALAFHITGDHNTATGGAALYLNADGIGNTATGRAAMGLGTTGSENTANGWQTLFNNTGSNNTANGAFALYANTTGNDNTTDGHNALVSNTTGSGNTAHGVDALISNTTGNNNTALGNSAGALLTTGNFNIDIANEGVADESSTIRIGTSGDQKRTFIAGIYGAMVANGVQVVVSPKGKLGTIASSERFKDQIKPMDKASEAILELQPVTFHYKQELDPEGIPQFGLVAEQVEKVNPALVARDEQGKVYTVRYEAVNAMLLNQFLKEHRNVQKLETTVAQQQKEISALCVTLREQASRIQKVSDQLEVSHAAPRLVVNDR
ncbi:MAG: tail fiber domain-containing protein [Chthoniobacterales bacterium]